MGKLKKVVAYDKITNSVFIFFTKVYFYLLFFSFSTSN